MFDMAKVTSYICNRYHLVVYDKGQCGYEQKAEGLLLNYASGNIVLLSEHGIYHIKYKDIAFMKPIKPPMDKFSEDFRNLLMSFMNENIETKGETT